ncbi:folate-binding protein YgfZ [Arenimonas soli]|uniref:Folate-binding protein YgfZ n=1 Tax=Arenimonas soli TaxID=2269504 RepID=A0ABQ1HG35_9GAMM|nr:folate-binding protein YgfZ [Arenimonas soli]GGA74348.1 folate-binding protein YgfZ [Arenimonas soli]
MSFKPNPAPLTCPTLPGIGLLRAAGRDAAAFLQAQAMNDVNALAPGRWQWNGLLTPKGRVIALFALLREADDQFLLVLPDYAAEDMAAHLKKFIFRSKLSLQPLDQWRACAGPAPSGPDRALANGDADAGWVLDLSGDGTDRGLWLLPAGDGAIADEDPETTQAWRQADLAHGLPRLPGDQRETWTPQMLSLDRLGAFSLKKGCYPGQEIVSRTHYLGQAKRGLVRLQAKSAPPAGTPVLDPQGRELGRLVCAGGDQLLAVLATDPDAGDLSAAGQPLVRRELLNGLAR